MGQDIKYIALHKDNQIPNEIVHFVENDALIIPLDLYDGDFERLMKEHTNFKSVDDIFDFILNELINEDSVVNTVNLLKSLKIDTFVLSGYREILDIPQEDFWIVVRNGKLIKNKTLEDPHKLIGLATTRHNIAINEKRYYSLLMINKIYPFLCLLIYCCDLSYCFTNFSVIIISPATNFTK